MPLPSLELGIEDSSLSCGDGLSCAYRDTISWQGPTSPLPMQNIPQVVFERLFGDGSTDALRRARREQSLSLLDSVMGDINSLNKKLPASDRSRVEQYLERCARNRAAHREGRAATVARSQGSARAHRHSARISKSTSN